MALKLPARFIPNFWFPIAIGLYSLVFLLPIPQQVNFRGIQIVDEFIVLLSCTLIFFAFKKTGWGWETLALTLTLTIFTLPLLRIWESAESNYNLVLGLLPWSDAGGYYRDAITFLQGGFFGEFSGHRPLFASFLAVLLNINRENILTSLVILTMINGLVVFLFAREIQESFGSLAGAGVTLLLQIYYRQFAGVLLTEQLGLPLGLIALSSLIYATQHKNKWLFSVGLFLLTLALLARAGAFFVLPALLIVGSILFKENERFSPKNNILLLSALLAGWGINLALGHVTNAPGITPLGNFSYTLYGQAMGGKGWTQVFIDHPEINGLPNEERMQTIYRLTLNEILRNPAGLAAGFSSAWKDFFVPGMFAGFGFIQPGDKYSSPIIQAILTILLFVGLFQSWQHRNQEIYLLLLAITGGVFISIPFIPPSESAYMRIYAVTVAIPSLLACLGLISILGKWIAVPSLSPTQLSGGGWFITGAGLALAFITLAGVLIIRATVQPGLGPGTTCQPGSIPLQFKLSTGSFISVATNESGQQTYVPTVSARDFRQSMRAFPGIYSDFSRSLIETVTPPILLTYTRNLLTGDFVWLLVPSELANTSGKAISACGLAADQGFSVIYIKSAQ